MGQARHNLPHRCNSCKPGSTPLGTKRLHNWEKTSRQAPRKFDLKLSMAKTPKRTEIRSRLHKVRIIDYT
ncbi:hypothetical protein SFRURICE_007892 [Spodoptera frugiperda]|nr:hypothetical protein SFRURICE_007892 [Spodoptera frugiperda]